MTSHLISHRTSIAAIAAIAFLVVSCAPAPATTARELHVVGTDYAFVAPDTIDAGVVHVSFENRGRVPHELLLARIARGVTTQRFTDSLFRDGSLKGMREGGGNVLFASPGRRNDVVRLRMTFAKGERWALWCQFQDSASAPKHQMLGMAKLLVVR